MVRKSRGFTPDSPPRAARHRTMAVVPVSSTRSSDNHFGLRHEINGCFSAGRSYPWRGRGGGCPCEPPRPPVFDTVARPRAGASEGPRGGRIRLTTVEASLSVIGPIVKRAAVFECAEAQDPCVRPHVTIAPLLALVPIGTVVLVRATTDLGPYCPSGHDLVMWNMGARGSSGVRQATVADVPVRLDERHDDVVENCNATGFELGVTTSTAWPPNSPG